MRAKRGPNNYSMIMKLQERRQRQVVITPPLRTFQLCRRVYRNQGEEALKPSSMLYYDSPTTSATRE